MDVNGIFTSQLITGRRHLVAAPLEFSHVLLGLRGTKSRHISEVKCFGSFSRFYAQGYSKSFGSHVAANFGLAGGSFQIPVASLPKRSAGDLADIDG